MYYLIVAINGFPFSVCRSMETWRSKCLYKIDRYASNDISRFYTKSQR